MTMPALLMINDMFFEQSPDDGCVDNYWLNPNIKIMTGGFSINQPSTIKITVHNHSFQNMQLNLVEATVCALNTIHGFNTDSILPSLAVSPNKLSFEGPDLITSSTQDYTLGPWTPTQEDGDYLAGLRGAVFDKTIDGIDLHVCVFAVCTGQQLNGTSDGTFPNWGVVGDKFCTDRHHGQLNTTLHRTQNKLTATVAFFAGLGPGRGGGGGGGGGGGNAKVFLREQVFDPQAHQGLVEMIRLAGLVDLPIQPAPVPARVAGIARFRSVGERIEQKAEEILDEAREVLEHLRGHWADEDDEGDPGTPRNVVTLQLAPGELKPLLLKVAFDKDDPLGAVHVFDVVQLNQDGTRGGFRLATINTPAE